MDWCIDTRVSGAGAGAEAELAGHLARHAVEPSVVELARPVVREALSPDPPGVLWVSLDWEAQLARLEIRRLPDGPVAGDAVGPGLSRAHNQAAKLLADHGSVETVAVELGVARAPEGDLDPGPGDPSLLPAGQPLAVTGMIATDRLAGATLEEAAARAGATLGTRVGRDGPDTGEAAALAAAFVAAEAELGADFHVVSASGSRVVLGNRRCPFGPSPSPGLCRFTSALAGSLGAQVAGGAEVSLPERLALGDVQCRLVLDAGKRSDRLTAHRYSWPAAGMPSDDEDPAAVTTAGFRVTLSLQLPRDRLSVPVARHLVAAAMDEVGVVPEDGEAVKLAMTEACANVIDHSGPGDVYDLAVTLGPTACHIRVVDVGRGFDHAALAMDMATVDAEHGRGVALMHALVDQVRFESEPEQGTVVHLVKRLRFDDSAPARRLMLQASGGKPDS